MILCSCAMCRGKGTSGEQNSVAAKGKQREDQEEVRQEPTEETDLSGTDSESEADDEEVVWGRSGVDAKSYKRKMAI